MDMTLARPPVGQVLDGRYRVEAHIARGGMATVYLGTDTRLERTVALKIMHPELANDQDFVRRFVGEARSIARLSHPNVVAVYDQGADGRTLYLAMEHVPGQTLRARLNEQGRLSPREALDIMDGVLAGLAAAHDSGIVHRDVKPENVLLTRSSSVKVADFGLARMVAGTSHTKTGMIIGTAAYLAPEQVSRGTADARPDVYAAGVVLFELLTGQQPHTGENPLAVAHKHVSDVVPAPSGLVPGLPPALDTLVALATSRDPDLRPADAGQFLRAITEVRNGLPVMPPQRYSDGPQYPGGSPYPAESRPPAGPQYPTSSQYPTAPHYDTDGETPPAGTIVPAASWGTADELIPGMGAPARQPYGQPRDTDGYGSRPPATHELQQPYRTANPTLIVSPGGTRYVPEPGGYRGPREPGLQRWLFSRRLGYLLAGLLVLVLAGSFAWWQTSGRYATVPGLRGTVAATAGIELRNEGLVPLNGKAQLDNSVPKGEVIRTDPASGSRVRKGGQVTLIVSAGPHVITVPQVTGLATADAESQLRHAGLTAGKVRSVTSATIPAGIVISTSPAAGASWPQPKPVTLVVSSGPPVPDFVGQQKGVAEQWAQQVGVKLNEVQIAKSDQPAGTVTHQSVPAGSSYTAGQVITIDFSPGPQQVAIPNVDGLTADKATHILEKLGFQVTVTQTGPLRTVFNYSPSGQAPQGSTITLYIGLPNFG